MVVLREEVEGPTAASHPSGPAWRAGLDRFYVTWSLSREESTGSFHQSGVNNYLR